MEPIIIDGSYGEGGGQIFRSSLAYASVVLKPVRIINIRAKRDNPGLRPQHLTVLKALAEITDAKVHGAQIGSMNVTFEPRQIKGGNHRFDVGTAGSISLVLQGILPVLLFADKESQVEIRGGTDVPLAPPIDAIRFVLNQGLKLMGANIEIELIRRGHYPRGGGLVRVYVDPIDHLKPIVLTEQGKVNIIRGISHCVKLPDHVAKRQAAAVERFFKEKNYRTDIELEYYKPDEDPHLGPGSGIVCWAETSTKALLSGDSLGERGKPAEDVGTEAARELWDQITKGGAVDKHHTDQLIIFMALAKGVSIIRSSEISLHTLTAIHVASKIVGAEFKVEGNLNTSGIIQASGIGFTGGKLY
ncbi:MAG: RNA 3'-terminal phosphate cyclase [Crenarchaeota archaeon]|nr:RNA 3'-terminal phosphate cyclase [Thermoproteota archaeon]MCR8454735.1 RNA 3'-terminal phosphate cyclase [Thermoproteota archaeon]MCR8463409.1 RNA 3'-terminal phosphate cyclase [Thermoproteota archaeon]MCR8470246.1 RNA 3'-terminal phosphate cyclase [Thermoproteota archaeon]MCR8472189.1 RNA 3'-terminal phosphate cyclase [Thermoproteota archaeon]